MKRSCLSIITVSVLLAANGCTADYRNPDLSPEVRTRVLLKRMTLEEKVGQMCQWVGPCYVEPGKGSAHTNIDASDGNLGNKDVADRVRRGEIGSFLHVMTSVEAVSLQKMALESRLGIPLLFGIDAIHGNCLIKGCTVYPTNIGMASSFNPQLLEKICAETAQEMRHCGMAWAFAPNLDVCRDARWGRMGETFGEDPFLVGTMGRHAVFGLQGRDGYGPGSVMACAKHLIAGGEPTGGINASPMDMSERKMREIFLPPFVQAVKEAGVGSVMAAHNELNGIPCHGNSRLMKDLLRDELGFGGMVVSDWMDIERMHLLHRWQPSLDEAFAVSVDAGIDMHMQGDGYFDSILRAVRSGRLSEKQIDRAAGNILLAKFRLGLFENPIPEMHSEEDLSRLLQAHRQTALQAARESVVMLKNDGVLPLGSPRRIFVCGPNADSQTILGDWAVPQDDEDVITVAEGIRSRFPDAKIDTMCFGGRISDVDSKSIAKARLKAAFCDLCILVLGENTERYSSFGRTCGENCDRDNLSLPGRQQELMQKIVSLGKPTVLVLLNGRSLSLPWAQKNVNAILEAWEPGMMGGQAVAEILAGDVNPSGKLPATVPLNVGQVQTVYNYKPMQYSRKYVQSPTGRLYPFGFGLSYTTYLYGQPTLSKNRIRAGETVEVKFTLANTGKTDGVEIAQMYINDNYASVTRPVLELKGFMRVPLKAGEIKELSFEITPQMLQCWGAAQKWTIEPGEFTVFVGPSSDKSQLKSVQLEVVK